MNLRALIALAALSLATQQATAEFPKIASLKPEEMLYVSMVLNGATTTGADFLFTPDQTTVRSLDKKFGNLHLTPEEKVRVDEYLELVRLGERIRGDGGGCTYIILFIRDKKKVKSWSFSIADARESKKPTLSLYALKNRFEEQQKEKQKRPKVPRKATY